MRRLLVFLKDPAPGRVKTRLAQAIGPDAASAVSRACAELTLERLGAFRAQTTLYVDPPEALPQVRAWLGAPWIMRPQQGRTLGDRLADATRHAFGEGATRVVVLGTDSPWLRAEDVEAAFHALEQAELVLGPTEDGGYYLLGLSRRAPALFQGIAWSSPRVYAQTLERARALGLRIHPLPMGYDLDYLEDVKRFLEEERRRDVIPATVQAIDACSQRREACRS